MVKEGEARECKLDGVLEPSKDGQVRFLHASALTAAEIAGTGEQVRRRVLRWLARSGLCDLDFLYLSLYPSDIAGWLLS
jgi:hypothetical protein